jgi:16S rRNA (uracil1498-N3)-methyltransferase
VRTLLAPPPLTPGTVELPADEAAHGLKVLRLRVGDQLRLADGDGRAGVGTVVAAEKRSLRVAVEAVEVIPDPPAAQLAVAVAAPKGDRLADLVRGLTELGVGRIAFLATERSERDAVNLERLRRIAAEALKQCRRGRLPQLGPILAPGDLPRQGARVILLDCAGQAPRPGSPAPTWLAIGPEGGWTDAERAALVSAGAEPVRVATPVLRIETAALAAAAVWAAAWEHAAS